MLNKIKHISIFIIVTFYVMQSCTLFSGTLIKHIQEIRNQIQISKIHLAEKKIISISDWKKLSNRNEIKLDKCYYDVLSYKISSHLVVITVVKDKHESDFRVVIAELFNKKNNPYSEKKKNFETNNYISIINKNQYNLRKYFKLPPVILIFYIPKKNTNKIIIDSFKPPC